MLTTIDVYATPITVAPGDYLCQWGPMDGPLTVRHGSHVRIEHTSNPNVVRLTDYDTAGNVARSIDWGLDTDDAVADALRVLRDDEQPDIDPDGYYRRVRWDD